MANKIKKHFLNYSIYGNMLNNLVDKLQVDIDQHGPFNFITTFPFGGYPILTHFSKKFNLTPFDNNFINDYTKLIPIKSRILVVDDIADTGETLKQWIIQWGFILSNMKCTFRILTLAYKPRSFIRPDFFELEVTNDTWVVFPWEDPDEKPNRVL